MNTHREHAFWMALALVCLWHGPAIAQDGAPVGEWRYIGGNAAHTRFIPLDQVNAENFEDLELAWLWRGDNFGPRVDHTFRSTPIYVDGLLYTVAGYRRTVVAIDPATGETIWTYREPHTTRWERGMRNNYGIEQRIRKLCHERSASCSVNME